MSKPTTFFTEEEKIELFRLHKQLVQSVGDSITPKESRKIKKYLIEAVAAKHLQRDAFGMNPIIRDMRTAIIVSEEMEIKGECIVGVLMQKLVGSNFISLTTIESVFGKDVATIIKGLIKINRTYGEDVDKQADNVRNLLLSLVDDMRVILIMIADRVNIMRHIKDAPNNDEKKQMSKEAASIYAPLAHKLGLYKLKSELEDLSLKYSETEKYYFIKEKLNATKAARDKYIASFINPLKQKLQAAGLEFDIKGRTKSIHSINNKMVKQKTEFEGIYDLFAIRIILESPRENEKLICWQAYSIVTDMYQPNSRRLRDWLSIPKSNGYESLHITVMGPEGKWVEVQIRTRRMDEIAERGLAAHWRYKGVKGESTLDEWLTSVREALEHPDTDSMKVMDQFKMDLYADEVFAFTPQGKVYKLPQNATVLDFAFYVHTQLGSQFVGAKVNGKMVPIRYKLQSGDQVEILKSSTQTAKQDWLKIATTSRARAKIRQSLKEMSAKQNAIAREALERRCKNRKIELEESLMTTLIKRMGYKTSTEFYQAIADNVLDTNTVIDKYIELQKKETETQEEVNYRSAENYNLRPEEEDTQKEDVLVIDQNLKGIDFKLAKCCSPIYGDEVFGFTTVMGGIKVHKVDCPNAKQMRERFGYRIVKARWAGKSQGTKYPITLRVVGHDDIGIVTNITSIISKETDISLRSIGIDSNDGLFWGTLTIMVGDTTRLEALIKKLRTIKGVKQVNRN